MLKKSECAIAAISDDVDGDLGDVDHQQLMRKRVAIDASLHAQQGQQCQQCQRQPSTVDQPSS